MIADIDKAIVEAYSLAKEILFSKKYNIIVKPKKSHCMPYVLSIDSDTLVSDFIIWPRNDIEKDFAEIEISVLDYETEKQIYFSAKEIISIDEFKKEFKKLLDFIIKN